jgi:tripartite-type tricarboxylate transporter receptor subunit TctC
MHLSCLDRLATAWRAGRTSTLARRRARDCGAKPVSMLARLGGALVLTLACTLAHAADYPNRSVRIIVPYAAGGQADVAVRILARQFSQQLGQPFVVENIPGTNGIAAINALMRSPADGYTLSYGDAGHWAINFALNPGLPYDPEKDFAPIGLFGETAGLFLVVNDAVPARTLQELVALARASPGMLSYASAGVGSIHHILMEDFKARLGLDIVHIPYKGSSQAMPAVVGGQVPVGIASLANVTAFARDARIRVLGIGTLKRSPMAPSVPPMAEAGAPGFNHDAEVGLIARAGVPPAIIDQLAQALAKAIGAPEVAAAFAQVGLTPVTNTTPQRLAERIREDRRKYDRLARKVGITAD